MQHMSGRWVLLAMVAAAAMSAAPLPLMAGENYALLVAVGDYDLKELRPLRFTRSDVIEFQAALVESGFPAKNIVLMHDDVEKLSAHYRAIGAGQRPRDYLPEGAKIRKELELLLGRLRPEDSVVVAFSGHGVQFKGEKKSYFCPADARLERKDSLIGFDEVFVALKECAAGRKLFLVDACQNDPLSEIGKSRRTVDLDSVTRPQMEAVPEGIIALFSCKAGQKSFELPELGHGIFFYHLLDGWRGAADTNGDGKLSYQEIAVHTEKKTAEFAAFKLKVLQTPQLRAEFSGEWVLRELPRPGLPPPLFDATRARTAAEARGAQDAWARHLRTKAEIENSHGMKLRLIPPGEYRRGSTPDEIDSLGRLDPSFRKEHGGDEQPQHTVRLTRPFLLGATEVTRGQFQRFVSATGYVTQAEKDDGGYGFNVAEGKFEGRDRKYNWKNTGFTQTDEHPVVNVTWNDAKAFVDWLSREEGKEYRLPTEAEWEYACRAGTVTRFQSGDDPETLAAVGNLADGTAKKRFSNWVGIDAMEGHIFTAPAGKLRANGFGLFDMHGNVWEWCADWYDPEAYAQYAGRTADAPQGPSEGSRRSIRGGAWGDGPLSARSANREGDPPDERIILLGFRVALELSVK